MGVAIMSDPEQGDAFVCTSSDTVFGPLMEFGTGDEFMETLSDDPRVYDVNDLVLLYGEWITKRNEEVVEYE